ncbi:MAG: alkaline phosphatase family protein [Chloroflexi bacterium]|nr:alkaline phosphatase family protein [Chloroflexota bacterium]
MKPVVTVFMDGLKADSLKYMPFISSLGHRRRLRTQLGYSNPSHASMYSGVYPNKHRNWFVWRYAPDTSPFKWLQGIGRLPHNIYTKYAFYRTTTALLTRHNTAFCDVPFLWWLPMSAWSNFDVNEKKFWSEPGFLTDYPTIFDVLRAHHVPYEVIGMVKGQTHRALGWIEAHNFSDIKPWTYLFIGDIDGYSHRYGPDSVETQERLGKIDRVLEQKYRLFEKALGDFCFMLYSDHGHMAVKEGINLSEFFAGRGKDINDYIHIIDINYARFWFRNEKEAEAVTEALSSLGKGFILTEEHLRKYRVDMPDNRYGDLIYYLDTPGAFTHGLVSVLGKPRGHLPASIHGYLPDYPDMDGVFVSNRSLVGDSHLELVDIMPSILDALDLPIPGHVEGKSVWSDL